MSRLTAQVQLAQIKRYLRTKELPSNKHYTCGACGAILAHDAVRPHWVQCPNTPHRASDAR